MAVHAVASTTLTTFTCTCGLSFTSAVALTAHITAANLTDSGSSTDNGATGQTAPAMTDGGLCGRPGCGHPFKTHILNGQCVILLGAYSTEGPCACKRYNRPA